MKQGSGLLTRYRKAGNCLHVANMPPIPAATGMTSTKQGPTPMALEQTIRSLLRGDHAALARRAWTRSILTGRELLLGGALAVVVLLMLGALSPLWGGLALLALLGWFGALAFASTIGVERNEAADYPGYSDAVLSPVAEVASCRAVLAGLPDPAMVLDGRSFVLANNAAARELFGAEAGRHIAQAIRAPELLRAVDLAIWRDEAQALEVRLPPPRDRTLAAHLTPLGGAYARGRPSLLVVLRDTTEQEQLSRMRADFVANASHELRTPLASLKGFIETLQGAAKDDPKAREHFLAIMNEQASRMSRLIEDLLSLSRVEMREHVPPSAIVDLAGVVDEVVRSLRCDADAAGISIATSCNPGVISVTGDRDELVQVVQNLVQNALKYGRPGGRVEVSISLDRQQAVLAVRDDGIGIEAQHLPRLTERFYRVNAKESRARGGTGLGLAIVKHIVNRHRGELKIASEVGKGSEFKVLLPHQGTSVTD